MSMFGKNQPAFKAGATDPGSSNAPIVDQVMKEYPGFKNSPDFKNGVQVIDSTPDRQMTQYGQQRYSEYYAPGEKGGTDQLNNPGDIKKAVLEIYNRDVIKNPEAKKELIMGELLHGAKQDPQYAKLRSEFAKHFTQDEVQAQIRNMKNPHSDFYSETPGETPQQMMERSGIDAYIRGHFMKSQGDEWTKGYSPKQKEIIQQLESYLKTGSRATRHSMFIH